VRRVGLLTFTVLVSGAVSTGVAGGDMPGTDGGPADRGCKPVIGAAYYVGATNMVCSNARRVAKRAIRGNAQRPKWKCTGVGSSFGHCHGRGQRSGKTAHWAVNDKGGRAR
jgi:hypothetical protein